MSQRVNIESTEHVPAMALAKRAHKAELLYHSHRDGQHIVTSYEPILDELRCHQYQKVFIPFEREPTSYQYYATCAEAAQQNIFNHIEVFNNQQHRHSTLSNVSLSKHEARTALHRQVSTK